MTTTKRATIYFDEGIHKALRVKAAETDRSISGHVNSAVRRNPLEDAEDSAAFRDRAREPTLAFEDLVRDMKRRGKLKAPHQGVGCQANQSTSREGSQTGCDEDPRACQGTSPVGCEKLSGEEKYRLRQGDYRIRYEIVDDELIVASRRAPRP